MAGPMWLLMAAILSALGLAAQLDLDCAKPGSARALIDYAQLSEIEQVEDIHRDELDHALQRCPAGPAREVCRAEKRRQSHLDWDRKVAEIKTRYQRMREEFEERCRASIARSWVIRDRGAPARRRARPGRPSLRG